MGLKKRIFINCFNKQRNKEFFLVVEMDDYEHLELIEELIDRNVVLKKSSKNRIEELSKDGEYLSGLFLVFKFLKYDKNTILTFYLERDCYRIFAVRHG